MPHFDAASSPDSWPVLDAAAVPFSRERALQGQWRQSRRIEPTQRPVPVPVPALTPVAAERLPLRRPSPLAQWWLDDLPAAVRPRLTAERHPHVLDQLALAWDRPAERAAALRDLLLADRHDRQGFSFDVLEELARIQAFAQAPGVR